MIDHELYPSPEFIAASRPFGGTLDLDGMGERHFMFTEPLRRVKLVLSRVAEESPIAKTFINSVHFGYLFNKSPNAHAWKSNGLHFVGISSGLVHLIYNTLLTLLSFRGLLPQVGDDSGEAAFDPATLSSGFTIDRILAEEHLTKLGYVFPSWPKDPARSEYAFLVAQNALEFVLLHELSHCVFNHFDLVATYYGADAVSEWLSADEDRAIPSMVRQMMEHQADDLAIKISLRERLPELERRPGAEGYFTWALALDILFWLFTQRNPLVQSESMKSHPHPQIRSWYKCQVANDHCKGNPSWYFEPSEYMESLYKTCHLAALVVADCWRRAGLPGQQWAWCNSEENLRTVYAAYARLAEETTDLLQFQLDHVIDHTLYAALAGGAPEAPRHRF